MIRDAGQDSCRCRKKEQKKFFAAGICEISHHALAKKGASYPRKEECSMTMKPKKRPPEMVDAIIAEQRRRNHTDVLGSYTGVPWDEWEEPVQDADDL